MFNEWLKIRITKEELKLCKAAAAYVETEFSTWVRNAIQLKAKSDLSRSQP